jgi:hypothetical protein
VHNIDDGHSTADRTIHDNFFNVEAKCPSTDEPWEDRPPISDTGTIFRRIPHSVASPQAQSWFSGVTSSTTTAAIHDWTQSRLSMFDPDRYSFRFSGFNVRSSELFL